jgi:hypothetical protein
VLDFVNQALALWLIDRGSELGWDKAETRNTRHASYLVGVPEIANPVFKTSGISNLAIAPNRP